MTIPEHLDTWRGSYLDLQYKISRHGAGKPYTPCGEGTWCYYVYLPEVKLLDFAAHWLTPEVCKITPESTGFVKYDYYSCPAAQVEWHGGVSYYDKHGEVEGYRVVELGCDYNHLWDNERGYPFTLEEVLMDVQQTIRELQPLLKTK